MILYFRQLGFASGTQGNPRHTPKKDGMQVGVCTDNFELLHATHSCRMPDGLLG